MYISDYAYSFKVGYSPLLTACDYKNIESVRYLVGRPDVDVSVFVEETVGEGEEQRFGQRSGLHLAAIHDCHEIAKILIENGCKIDILDLNVRTSLAIFSIITSLRHI